jgi:hypothetical protein
MFNMSALEYWAARSSRAMTTVILAREVALLSVSA